MFPTLSKHKWQEVLGRVKDGTRERGALGAGPLHLTAGLSFLISSKVPSALSPQILGEGSVWALATLEGSLGEVGIVW